MKVSRLAPAVVSALLTFSTVTAGDLGLGAGESTIVVYYNPATGNYTTMTITPSAAGGYDMSAHDQETSRSATGTIKPSPFGEGGSADVYDQETGTYESYTW